MAKERFRRINYESNSLRSLPVDLAGIIVKLSAFFSFSNGKPIGREKMSICGAAPLVNIERHRLSTLIHDLIQWQHHTGWEYVRYERKSGIVLCVNDNGIGQPMVENLPTNGRDPTILRKDSYHIKEGFLPYKNGNHKQNKKLRRPLEDFRSFKNSIKGDGRLQQLEKRLNSLFEGDIEDD